MFTSRRRVHAGAAIVGVLLAVSACSSSGGKQATTDGGDDGSASAGKATTPKMTFAMVTHAPAGDTFFDIIRKGADAAAGKDNVEYLYSNDADPSQQATLVQAAIDKKVDGIAVSIPNSGAMQSVMDKANAAGIPIVMFNAGANDYKKLHALMYFGQDESVAGQAAGARLASEGAKKVVCVLQEQGQSQLEARCDGMAKGLGGEVTKLYVKGTDISDVQTKVSASLAQDKSIDHVVTLGAPFALAAAKAVKDAASSAKVVTFDTNAELVAAIQDGSIGWAIDQQPFLQGYFAIDALWFYKTNGNILGGGGPVLTGPAFIDKSNIEAVAKYAKAGTR